MIGQAGIADWSGEPDSLGEQIGAAMLTAEPGTFYTVANIAALLGDISRCGAIAARLEARPDSYGSGFPARCMEYPEYVVPIRVNSTLGAVRIRLEGYGQS